MKPQTQLPLISNKKVVMQHLGNGNTDIVFQLSPVLKDDFEFMVKVIKDICRFSDGAFFYRLASENLQNNPKFAIALLKLDINNLYIHFPDSLKSNPQVFMTAFKIDSSTYFLAPEVLKNNLEICLHVIKNHPWLHSYFAPEMQQHPQIISSMLRSSEDFRLPENLRNDKKTLLEILKNNKNKFSEQWVKINVPSVFLKDEEIIRAVLKRDPASFNFLSDEQKGNLELIHHLLNNLEYENDETADAADRVNVLFDLNMTIAAIHHKIYKFIPPSLSTSPENEHKITRSFLLAIVQKMILQKNQHDHKNLDSSIDAAPKIKSDTATKSIKGKLRI